MVNSQKEQEVQVLHIRFSILDARKRQKRKLKTSIEYLGSKYDSRNTIHQLQRLLSNTIRII